jgi:putative ABC transport system substrate-binding protein
MVVQERVAAFRQELRRLGWWEGKNLSFTERWTTDNLDLIRVGVAELAAAQPDVILATGGRVMPILKQQIRSIPVVFVATNDPVGRGLVASLARPGGNMTGYALQEFSVIGKMLDLLQKIAPEIRRVALIFNPDNAFAASFYTQTFNETAGKLGFEPVIAPIRGPADIEHTLEVIGREPNKGGALFPSDITLLTHRDAIVAAAARYRVPAIYADRAMVTGGGLLSYSVDRKDLFGRSAAYVDRILRGESPAELPVQLPEKYEFVLNLKTAQQLGLEPSPTLLFLSEVIE